MVFTFLRRGSRELSLFEKLANHLELSVEAAELVEKQFKRDTDRHEIESLAAQVIALEKRGDELSSEITKLLARSALPITMHGELERIVDLVDDILDELYFVSQEVARGRKRGLDSNEKVLNLYQDLAAMSSVAKLAIQKLKELVATAMRDIAKASELNIEIDALEDRVDEMRNYVLDKVYEYRLSLGTIELLHLIEIAKAIDRVVDTCKDVAHLVISVVNSSMV